jgi:hypothetical protein
MSLADKVAAVMDAEDFQNPVARAADPAFGSTGTRSQFELDVSYWGLLNGIAVVLARTEEPCEPIRSVVKRARAAACEVFVACNFESPGIADVRRELAGVD